jgi:uncharacterized protein YggE
MRLVACAVMIVSLLQVAAVHGHDPDGCYDIRKISVTGTAEVAYPPDFIVVRVGALLKGDDPKKLQQNLRSTAAKILAFVEELGIDEKDVTTDEIALAEADWYYDEDDCPRLPEGPRYEGDTSIEITLREFDLYERLIGGLFECGANRLKSVTFGSTQKAVKQREARIEAVRAARDKATYIAAELGQVLGRPLEVTEGRSLPVSRSYMSNVFIDSPLSDSEIGPASLSMTDLRATAEVSVVFALEDQSD